MDYNGFTKKDWVVYSVIIAILIFISVLFGGCKSTRGSVDANLIRDTQLITRVESALSDFDDAIAVAIRETNNIEDSVERVTELFERYERATLQLRADLRKTKAELENLQKIYGDNNNNSAADDSVKGNNDNP